MFYFLKKRIKNKYYYHDYNKKIIYNTRINKYLFKLKIKKNLNKNSNIKYKILLNRNKNFELINLLNINDKNILNNNK